MEMLINKSRLFGSIPDFFNDPISKEKVEKAMSFFHPSAQKEMELPIIVRKFCEYVCDKQFMADNHKG